MSESLANLITVLVAVVGVALCVSLPRRFALVPLILSLCLYPSNMILPPPGVGLTAQRVIALALVIRCLSQSNIRSAFNWSLVDTAAAIYFMLLTVSQVLTQPESAIVNRAGFFLSAMLPFWCTRFLITDRASLNALLKGLLWASLPLAVVGLFQMYTAYNPYFALQVFGSGVNWYPPDRVQDTRMFLGYSWWRASSPFLQCIMYGWFFALLITPSLNLFFEKRRIFPWILPWLALPFGCVAAVAAGPMMLAAMALGVLALFPWRRYGKAMLWAAVIAYMGIQLGSNRSPMELLANMGMDANSSWYSVGLQNWALGDGMSGHWITGHGEIPPSRFHDLCIHWVQLLVLNGLMGVVGFYGLIATVCWKLYQARKRAITLADQFLLWSLMATLVASLGAMMLTSLFSEMYYIYHMFLAVVANAGMIVGGAKSRQVGLLAEMNGAPVLLRYTLQPGQQLAVVHPAQKR